MKTLDDVETQHELLQWMTTCRKWKDALRKRTSNDNLGRLARILGNGTDKKSKAVFAEEIIRSIENLNTAGEPPAKLHKTVDAPSPATPKPTRQTSRSRSARRGGGNVMDADASTPARSPQAAEALAMSTRKPVAVDFKVTSPDMAQRFSRRSKLSADDVTPIVLE